MRAELPIYDGDARSLREMFSYFPSGVAALLAEIDGKPTGIVASALTVGVSMEPPLVSCAIRRASATWPELKQASGIGVSVLAEDHSKLARQIASKDVASRFEGVPLRHVDSSARFIARAPVWFECTFFESIPPETTPLCCSKFVEAVPIQPSSRWSSTARLFTSFCKPHRKSEDLPYAKRLSQGYPMTDSYRPVDFH
jgi:flavin reductase (DIM6/NTAB) family NADH-FMN oxidoreductase RutF